MVQKIPHGISLNEHLLPFKAIFRGMDISNYVRRVQMSSGAEIVPPATIKDKS
jgi:hypothetical protein